MFLNFPQFSTIVENVHCGRVERMWKEKRQISLPLYFKPLRRR